MKKIYSIIISIALIFGAFTPVHVLARANQSVSASDISIDAEYLIKDQDGLHSRYVVIASNSTGSDISVKADFYALNSEGSPIVAVHDSADAVKAGQSFIMYGQFKNDAIADAASFTYDLRGETTSQCRYDAVGLDVQKSADNELNITGTNFSASDVNLINVRGVFFKDGAPVAFDTVNIGDSGYTLRSGSSGIQQLGMTLEDYDDYVITYTASSDITLAEDL